MGDILGADWVRNAALIAGVVWGLILYNRQRRLEQARWQRELFKDIYLNEKSYDARHKLEYAYTDDLAPILQKRLTNRDIPLKDDEIKLIVQLDNFLNVFENTLYYAKKKLVYGSDLDAILYYWFEIMKSPERGLLRRYLIDFGFRRIVERLELSKSDPQYIFFYGTMRDAEAWTKLRNESGEDLANYISKRSCQPARTAGELRVTQYGDQKFPMLKAAFGQSAPSYVRGNIYQLIDPSAAFRLIDQFEKFDATHELRDNLFIRNCIQVEIPSKASPEEVEKVDAWLYVFNKHKPDIFNKGSPEPSGYWQGG
jgi:hypothetical protein